MMGAGECSRRHEGDRQQQPKGRAWAHRGRPEGEPGAKGAGQAAANQEAEDQRRRARGRRRCRYCFLNGEFFPSSSKSFKFLEGRNPVLNLNVFPSVPNSLKGT